MGGGAALAGTLAVAVAYVAPMALWNAAPRDHPSTIRGRAACAVLACCVAWLPLYFALWSRLGQVGGQRSGVGGACGLNKA